MNPFVQLEAIQAPNGTPENGFRVYPVVQAVHYPFEGPTHSEQGSVHGRH